MTDLAATEAPLSTTLEPNDGAAPSGGGVVRAPVDDKPAAPDKLSLRDTIAAAAKDAPKETDTDGEPDGDAAKGKEGAEKGDAKPEGKPRAQDGRFAAKEPARPTEGDEQPDDAEAKPAEPARETEAKRTGHIEPPKNFLPDAKETWRNTPRAVQRDVENTIRTYEAQIQETREVAERYAPLREFDELVRANGRAGLHETLAEVKQLEDLMEANPIAGLNKVLQRAGPVKADGTPYSLYEVAQSIVQAGPDGYQRMAAVPQPAQQQPREDPRVAQLQQQLAQVQATTLEATVIAPFKAEHPRYDELKDDIAFFLQSGRIPASLSVPDRLAAAYDMAVRFNGPTSHDAGHEPEARLEPADRVASDSSGSKSLKSAPGAVSADMEPERGGSIRDLLASELKRTARR